MDLSPSQLRAIHTTPAANAAQPPTTACMAVAKPSRSHARFQQPSTIAARAKKISAKEKPLPSTPPTTHSPAML